MMSMEAFLSRQGYTDCTNGPLSSSYCHRLGDFVMLGLIMASPFRTNSTPTLLPSSGAATSTPSPLPALAPTAAFLSPTSGRFRCLP
ncbi:uncharacterized protein NFIA_079680 [Aspergillus fischeri NRRL 181]|uniref:Uncharacterized protein n=1 Tax=Neosartorya fischeri (strain ATCC 1020 / DSM 3700 / CBS 544.65 / FGSC A1164 / JCM 1740 / NRRL 181 / WB 181) TaxID=331117 RepID=A1DF69_NEOFI|nr:uncharacterized protein NFIA_079680 [Aspergillus fischeri NRRL 181]EAW18026.1 hypothetical protein NFIA_079680 [Aspergillus fischeri NRRL 181]